MPERLQQDRPRRVHAHGLLLQVDPPVAQVGHGPHGAGQVPDVPDGEPVVAHHRQQHPLGEGARRRSRPWPGPTAASVLDRREVVAALAHHRPQVRVGRAGFLGRRGRLGPLLAQLGVQRDQVLDHVARHPRADPQVRQAQVPVDRVALRLLQGDLQLGPPAGRLAAQQFLGRHRQRGRQRLDQGQLGLAAAVLDQRQHRGRAADALAELGQRQPLGAAGVPEPLAEHPEIQALFGEGFRIFFCEDCHIFTLRRILAEVHGLGSLVLRPRPAAGWLVSTRARRTRDGQQEV